MKAIKFDEYRKAVGQKYITKKSSKFPPTGWCWKTIDNVIYVWSKACVSLMDIYKLEEISGKQVKLCLVPKEIINHTKI